MELLFNIWPIGITSLVILTLGALELWRPTRAYTLKTKKTSYITNILLFIFNNIALLLLQVGTVFVLVSSLSFKFINLDALPVYIVLPLSIIILDMAIWLWHMLNHKVNFFWRFHKCHHSERYLNVTSALRFHIGELVLSIVFKALVLLVTGIPLWAFFVYESLITMFAIFHHANITLPTRLQNKLSLIIITPPMHRTHHSALRHEHDNNYGVIFSFWDRLFKTYSTAIPKDIGLRDVTDQTIIKVLTYPVRD